MTNTFGITARAYAFYDDGTEAASLRLSAENATLTLDVFGDENILLRYGVQESGAGSASGLTTDDYQLQHKLNAGAFTNTTTGTTVVRAFSSLDLTDAGATTQRLSSGSGSFIAGAVSEDGLLDNWQLTANNFSEFLYAITIRSADVAAADSITFRVLRNAAVFDVYTVTPTITVAKTTPVYLPELVTARAGPS